MDSIFRIGAFELVEIGPLVLEQAGLMSSQMSHIESLQAECQVSSKGIRETLGGISRLSQLVTEHLQKSQSVRNRLRYLTFNSIIEASRLGTEADTICVIADGIAEVSAEWTRITTQSESALQEILVLSTRVNGVMATLSQTNSEELKEAQVETQKGLGSLRSAAAFAVMQGEKIGIVTAEMQTRIGEVAKASDMLDACFARIDAVLRVLEDAKHLMEKDYPGAMEMYDKAEIESLYSASYTTEAERDVLRAAIYGMALPTAQQSSTGNDVELF
jgi:predicted transcriptional regulator